MKEFSLLTRSNCYILPYCQLIGPLGEKKYLAKQSPTAKPPNTASCSQSLYTLQGLSIPSDIALNPIDFKYITVQNAASFNDGGPNTRVRLHVTCSMEYSPFISQHFKSLFHCPSCFSHPVFVCTFKKLQFGEGDIAVAHVLVRRTPRQPQSQMARKHLSASLAEIWALENSVYCSVAIFQMSSV